MELLLGILGIVISSVISIIMSEKIINGIGTFLSKYDMRKSCIIEGEWIAEFTIIDNDTTSHFCESIRLVKRLGVYYGYNIPNVKNHSILKAVQEDKPLRIKATLIENRYFTGNWYHPDNKSRFHGSFQMLVSMNSKKMTGTWVGYSETKNRIDNGTWSWQRSE